MTEHHPSTRRRFLGLAAFVATPAFARSRRGTGDAPSVDASIRRIALHHTHTGERIDIAYAGPGGYDDAALRTLDRFLRDHYSGDVGRIDPRAIDQLASLHRVLGASTPFEVISGYRSPVTNERLRTTRAGGVARHSLHMEGRAIDVRLPGVALADLRDAALDMRSGGVGYYPAEQFVHVDTGPVRRW